MSSEITLSDFIKELQSIEEKCGNMSIFSLGASCDVYNMVSSPLTLKLKDQQDTVFEAYIPSRKQDIGRATARKRG